MTIDGNILIAIVIIFQPGNIAFQVGIECFTAEAPSFYISIK